MNIYFSGAIGGGRQKQEDYKNLIALCKERGIVWNECIGKKNIRVHKGFDVYSRNMDWIDKCDVFIAEVSVPSLGVGMEIEHAIHLAQDIPILCIYDKAMMEHASWALSKMVTNCPKIKLVGYTKLDGAKAAVAEFLDGIEAK